jgi:hypothetical protein
MAMPRVVTSLRAVLLAVSVALICSSSIDASELLDWSDVTGKYSTRAELVRVEHNQ